MTGMGERLVLLAVLALAGCKQKRPECPKSDAKFMVVTVLTQPSREPAEDGFVLIEGASRKSWRFEPSVIHQPQPRQASGETDQYGCVKIELPLPDKAPYTMTVGSRGYKPIEGPLTPDGIFVLERGD
jgi:hypothetical protein